MKIDPDVTPVEFRMLVELTGLTAVAIAEILQIDERTMRRYLSGTYKTKKTKSNKKGSGIPKTVELAVRYLALKAEPKKLRRKHSHAITRARPKRKTIRRSEPERTRAASLIE